MPQLSKQLNGSPTITITLNFSDEKLTKSEAGYREADDEDACGDCEHFTDPNRCSIVSGSIDPAAVCDYFEGVKNGSDGLDA